MLEKSRISSDPAMSRPGNGCSGNPGQYVMRGNFMAKELDLYHLILAPSYMCNMRCSHCYLPDHGEEMLTEEQVVRLIEDWSQVVVRERGRFGGIFHLSGGEPLLLPYLEDILDTLAEMGTMRFMMTTNGTFYGDETIEQLLRLNDALEGYVHVIVSLDGSCDEMNSILRGGGNFDKATGFIVRLGEAGITFSLNNVVHRRNLGDVAEFFDLACLLGATHVNFLSFVPGGCGGLSAEHRPDPLDVFDRISRLWKNGSDRAKAMLAGSLCDIVSAERHGKCTADECVGGYRGLLYVVPNGDVYSCPNLDKPELRVGNIDQQSCNELIESTRDKVYDKVRTRDGDRGCRFVCKGEKLRKDSAEFMRTDFAKLQDKLSFDSFKAGSTYCFSRNF